MFRGRAGQNSDMDTPHLEFCGLVGVGTAGQPKIQL